LTCRVRRGWWFLAPLKGKIMLNKEGLFLRKEGILTLTEWVFDNEKKKGEYVTRDVTDKASYYLFSECELESGILLRDIFLFVKKHINNFKTIINNWCEEYIEEGLCEERSPSFDIEFLELYWELNTDTFANERTFSGHHFPAFHGVSSIAQQDKFDGSYLVCKKGERTNLSLCFSNMSELASLPVKLKKEVILTDYAQWKDNPKKYEGQNLGNGSYTLIHIVYGVFWELSWYGSPVESDKAKEDIIKSLKEIESGEAKLIPWEKVKADLEKRIKEREDVS
jgi:hypothetical protein